MSITKIRNSIEYRVYGRYALFSDPITRMGAEKMSLPIPTYQAIKGITESIYFKPSIIWRIDAVRVIKPIKTEGKGIRPISYDTDKNTLSVYSYLSDVEYEVRAHFVANPYRTEPDLIADGQNENKHHNIAKRAVERGGRRDVFLGTRECQAYVEPCVYGEKPGFYDGSGEHDFGTMYHSMAYPDETGKNELGVYLWNAKMTDGEILYPSPDDADQLLYRYVRLMKPKKFGVKYGNFSEEGGGEQE